jgi:hypothetical protein
MQTEINSVTNVGLCQVRACANDATHEISWPTGVIKMVCGTHKTEVENHTFQDVRDRFGSTVPPRRQSRPRTRVPQ